MLRTAWARVRERLGSLPTDYTPMTKAMLFSSAFARIISLLMLGLIPLGSGECQTADQSVAKTIRFLTEPIVQDSDRLNKNAARSVDADRGAANSLVVLGPAVIPELESVFNVLDRQEQRTRVVLNSKWLLFAYARILGPVAWQPLRAMANNPRLRYLSSDLDEALAIALDLTSYISASRIADDFVCCRPEEPRHALNQLILGWLQGNRQWMEKALGPNARLALDSLVARRSWSEVRNETWHGVPGSDFALGYKFDGSDDWSKPEETLDQGLHDRRRFLDLRQLPSDPNLITRFVGISGRGCGSLKIKFLRIPTTPAWLPSKYVVDDRDLGALLRTVTECAMMKPE